MIPLKAASCRSQTSCLFVKRLNFLVELRDPRFWRISATQLIERLADGAFGCFSHDRILYGSIKDDLIQINATNWNCSFFLTSGGEVPSLGI
ncbi:MAG: hypothetical protein WAM12_04215 [Pseudolabrys sp.]